MTCDLEVNNESSRCREKNSSHTTYAYRIIVSPRWLDIRHGFASLWTEKSRSIERQKRTSPISRIDFSSDLLRGVHALSSGEAARRIKRGQQLEKKNATRMARSNEIYIGFTLSRVVLSVTRVVICVSRAFCSTGQK